MKVLLLGGGLQALSCGASLVEKEFTVDVISDEFQTVKSKFFNQVYTEALLSKDEMLNLTLKNGNYDVIIPMGDMNVSFLSKRKDFIEHEFGCKCACPEENKLAIVEDKRRFMEFCEKNGIPHPKTARIKKENLSEVARNIGFPSLIKPDFSVGARGITRVDTLDELKQKFTLINDCFGNCTLQELIDNKEYYFNVMLYRNRNGKILAYTIIKIFRMYPVSAGSSTCCISVDNEDLLDVCKDCLDKLNWVGMADLDVLQRLDNRDYKIIEINPRVPASLRAAHISGVNFPEVISLDSIGRIVPFYDYNPGKTMRYLGTDIMWFLKSNKRWKATPSWFKFIGKDIYYQDIYINDVSTWWTWLVEGLLKLKKRNIRLR